MTNFKKKSDKRNRERKKRYDDISKKNTPLHPVKLIYDEKTNAEADGTDSFLGGE